MTATLLTLTLQFSVILLGQLALRPLLRRSFGAACVYASWLIVPLLLAVAQVPASRPGVVLHQLVMADLPDASAPALPISVERTAQLVPWLWMAGLLASLASLAWQQTRYRQTLQWDAALDGWRNGAGGGPALMGLFPPRLVLPVDFEARFPPAQQQLILAHEAVHRARGDNFWNLLAALCAALQWFNPLAWWALRAWRIDQELACDAAVLRSAPDRQTDYTQALISAQGLTVQSPLWASWRSSHPLVERVAMLQSHAAARRRTGLSVLVVFGLLASSAVHAWRSPAAAEARPQTQMVMIRMSLTAADNVDGKPRKLRSSPRMLIPLGETASLTTGIDKDRPTAESLSVEMTPTQAGPGVYSVKARLSRGNPLKTFEETVVRVREGELATLDSGTDGEGRSVLLVLSISPHSGPVKPPL